MARTKQTARKGRPLQHPQLPGQQPGLGLAGPPETAMEGLMRKLFGDVESTYQPRFYLSRQMIVSRSDDDEDDDIQHQNKKKRAKPNPKSEDESLLTMKVLTHPPLLDFLAPHEILSLWRCCRTCWNSIESGRKKKIAILPSIFRYYKLSEEAALRVHTHVAGGWNAFLPLLVEVSQKLSYYYHHLEPDAAHRALIGEQICFVRQEEDHYNDEGLGKLATYEISIDQRPLWRHPRTRFPDDDDLEEEEELELEPTPTIFMLRDKQYGGQYDLSSLQWGQPHSYHDEFEGEAPQPRCSTVVNRFVTQNRDWMRVNAYAENASVDGGVKLPHKHYQERVSHGLYPLIVVGVVQDTESGKQDFSLGVGPNLEQFLVQEFYSIDTHEHRSPETFYYCANAGDTKHFPRKGGMMEFILGYAIANREADMNAPDFYDWKPKPTLGITIWAYRHSLEPLVNVNNNNTPLLHIDWTELIDNASRELQNPKEAKTFFMDALTNPLYGPANIEKWKKSLQEDSSSPAIVEWFQHHHHHHQQQQQQSADSGDPSTTTTDADHEQLTWASFLTVLEGLENCFLFLDPTWSSGHATANDAVRQMSQALKNDLDIRQKIFPGVQIIHIRYVDWQPRHTAFEKWWSKHFGGSKESLDEYTRYGRTLPELIHCQKGKIISVVKDLHVSYGDDTDPPSHISQGIRLLYLLSFGGKQHPKVQQQQQQQQQGDNNNNDGDDPAYTRWMNRAVQGIVVKVPPHDDSSAESSSLIPESFQSIAMMHSEGNYFVGEFFTDRDGFLERHERFPPPRRRRQPPSS